MSLIVFKPIPFFTWALFMVSQVTGPFFLTMISKRFTPGIVLASILMCGFRHVAVIGEVVPETGVEALHNGNRRLF